MRQRFEKLPAQLGEQSTEFELLWRRRFRDYGEEYEDESAIAGWTVSGLATRLRHFERHFPSCVTGRWLDAGCGAGTYTRRIGQRGAIVVGIDYSMPSAAKARARDEGSNLYLVADAKRLPFSDASFEGAVCFGVTQALAASDGIVASLARAIRPGGQIWIDALNAQCLPNAASEFRRRRKGSLSRVRFERHECLTRLLASNGFGGIRIIWLPIMPRKLQGFQWIFESLSVVALFRKLPRLGAWLSHSFVVYAEKTGSAGQERGTPTRHEQ